MQRSKLTMLISQTGSRPRRSKYQNSLFVCGPLRATWVQSLTFLPLQGSEEIVDKDSTFLAHAASITSSSQADVFRRHIRESHAEDPAGHVSFILKYSLLKLMSLLGNTCLQSHVRQGGEGRSGIRRQLV